jgi:hypothetical protein
VTVQELLQHPFLRPTAAQAPAMPDSLVGLTRAQLKKVLTQVCPQRASPPPSLEVKASIPCVSDCECFGVTVAVRNPST